MCLAAHVVYLWSLLQLYTYQLARALLFMHSFSIVHRDIKPQVFHPIF